MYISDISVTRPVFASVLSLLLLAFGLVAFEKLPLREYPDIDPPVVTILTAYPGAAATIVETRVTEIIEERIAGVEGIKFIQSSSGNGRSTITVEFEAGLDIDVLANDIRNRVSGILGELPQEVRAPQIQKVDSDENVIMWLNFVGDGMTMPELTDYADRYLVDRFSVLDGVARILVNGQAYAMRIWLNRKELAARNLTVNDIEDALRSENIELPAGTIESEERQFTVRVERAFRDAADFRKLVISRGESGYLVRLGDVARIEKAAVEDRTYFRGNGVPQVGFGIIKQSTANTIAVARAVKREAERVNTTLPEGMKLEQSYDTSVFIEGAISEVYKTLVIAVCLVILVIYLFLGSGWAMLVPAITVPVSIVATFIVMLLLDFSINLLTLLALVLSIGLIVDDGIVVLENVVRRMQKYNEPPLIAAYRGAQEVGFAVIATTLVLVSVFVPIAFLDGDTGRIFREFALTMAIAVGFSTLVALTLCPMLASKILKKTDEANGLLRSVNVVFSAIQNRYGQALRFCLKTPVAVFLVFSVLLAGAAWLYEHIPAEYAPNEDRGSFIVFVQGPEGASFSYIERYMDEIEERMMPYVESGEMTRLMIMNNAASSNTGLVITVLRDWGERRSGFAIMNEVRQKLSDLPGVYAYPIMRQGLSASNQQPVQFVIGGGTYQQLTQWRDILLEAISTDNPGLVGVNWDYRETTPQLQVKIDYDRAAELGVTVGNIGRSLETMLGSRRVTSYIEDGKEYDVLLQGERNDQRSTTSLENIYVRSDRSGRLIPLANLVHLEELADSNQLPRYNRIRALTLTANLSDDLPLGDALAYLEGLVREQLPGRQVNIDYKGQSLDFRRADQNMSFIFILGLLVTFLVLAAQFESFIHPFIILLTVPLAMAGGLLGLYLTDSTLNLYSQIGLIMLVGLAAKNGILIVEFANRLRDQGEVFADAILLASMNRLRPILMTGITTAIGAIPLILSSGAGVETRVVIGIVVFSGALAATFFTLFVVPAAYSVLARKTGSPGDVLELLGQQQEQYKKSEKVSSE